MGSEELITFHQNNFFRTSFCAFQEMRKTEELCDVVIRVENYSFSAHRVILAAGIPYFRTVFTGREVNEEEAEISIDDLDPTVLESMIDFAYTGTVKISTENVYSLLTASDFFLLDKVSDACVEFISKRFHSSNILAACVLARNLNNRNLIENTNSFIQQKFAEFWKTDYFVNLPYLSIKEIIAEDEINVPSEKTVYEAVVKWVKHSPSERHAVLPELLNEVRMVLFPTDYLAEHVATEELITSSDPCRELITEVQNYHLLNTASSLKLKTFPRKCSSIKDGIYAICQSGFSEYSIHNCDLVKLPWHLLSKVDTHSGRKDVIHGVVSVGGKIYLLFRETILTFHPLTLNREVLEVRHRGIGGSCIVAYGDIIYCFGSYDVDLEAVVRRFDTWENKWLEERIMRTPLCTAAATSMGESIFVTGGYSRGEHLNIVEKYNPPIGDWTLVAPMLTARRSHGCTTMSEKIYVCGGSNASGNLCTAEVYNPATNQWNYISSTKFKVNSFSFVTYNRRLYAFNGFAEVEIYDPECDKWKLGFKVPEGYKHTVAIPITHN